MDAFQAFAVVLPLLFLIYTLPELKLATTTATSFSLKLIHRDSIESPFCPGNLSFHERLQRNLEISESRVTYMSSIAKHDEAFHPDMMHPYVFHNHYIYLVQLGIGSPSKNHLLVLDTGSGLIWTQCKPCRHCYHQIDPIYDPRNSSTYRKVPCDNPLCKLFKCINGECLYTMRYMDNSTINGVASWETFHFHSDSESVTHVDGLLFGCSYDNEGFSETVFAVVSGILGSSRATSSLIFQLGSFIEWRFSYCFTDPLPDGGYPVSYLKFGTDMGYRGGPVQTTPFVENPRNLYYLNLLDISIDNKRLNYPPHTFDIKPNGEGGCIIDSGSVLSYIHKDAYWLLHEGFVSYFDQFRLKQLADCHSPVRLCYELPAVFKSFPSMTYHFQGANLTIAPEHVFIVDTKRMLFLLAVAPWDAVTLPGAWQQRNTRFVYDFNIDSLWFVPENCAKDEG